TGWTPREKPLTANTCPSSTARTFRGRATRTRTWLRPRRSTTTAMKTSGKGWQGDDHRKGSRVEKRKDPHRDHDRDEREGPDREQHGGLRPAVTRATSQG